MFMKMKTHLKNQRGLTLIELLAVVVILGIISAIAVPSIGGLIDNTKKDAHVANAQQMINAAKIHVTSQPPTGPTTTITLNDMYTKGLLEPVADPDTKAVTPSGTVDGTTAAGYQLQASKVVITKNGNSYSYAVYLKGKNRSVSAATSRPATETTVSEGAITREHVQLNTAE